MDLIPLGYKLQNYLHEKSFFFYLIKIVYQKKKSCVRSQSKCQPQDQKLAVFFFLCVCVCVCVCVHVCVCVLVAQSCPTLCDPLDCSPPGSSVHGILQARILEWVAIPFSKGNLPNSGIKLGSPKLQIDSSFSEPPGKPLHLFFQRWSY